MEIHLPRLLLISGNGRDSGKTTLACRVISNVCRDTGIIAVKVSPHAYGETSGFSIKEEDGSNAVKDSNRMLRAGALQSYFVVSSDNTLPELVPELERMCQGSHYVICESGGLRNFVKPGLFIIVNKAGQKEIKPGTRNIMKMAHHWLTFDGTNFDPPADICIHDGKWKINLQYDI